MRGADERPFGFDVLQAAQKELTESSGMLDLSEDGLDDLLSQAVAAAPTGTSELGCHGRNARAHAPSSAPPSVSLAVASAARGNESVDAAAGQVSEIGLITEAGVGGNLARVFAQLAAWVFEQSEVLSAVIISGMQSSSCGFRVLAVRASDHCAPLRRRA